jgi:hypothetical protein
MSDSFGKSASMAENESQQIAIYQSEDGSIRIEVQIAARVALVGPTAIIKPV